MRIVLALVACSACLHTSVDTDGMWSSLDTPCVSVGDQRKILDTRFTILYMPAGDSLLYSGGQTVSQLDIASGESKIVLRSDGITQFGAIGNSIVYYEGSSPIDVIVDHGARSTSRYERISPRPDRPQAGLMTTPAGVYWWTSFDGAREHAEYWRWDPALETVEPYPLDSISLVRTDDDSFFYTDPRNRLIVQPQTPGPLELVIEKDPEGAIPQPIGIDGDELYYVDHTRPTYYDGDLVARGADGVERVLTTDRFITGGALAPGHVYFTEDCSVQDGGPFGMRCQNLYRIPRAGGVVETVFEGEPNSVVFDVTVDRCNVYWQHFTVDGGAVYGREITR